MEDDMENNGRVNEKRERLINHVRNIISVWAIYTLQSAAKQERKQ